MKTLGKFEVIDKIGQGAMGVVYKARDPYIGRLVALKTITTGLSEDPALLERFYQEARSAGALQHPNIVTIYELGKEGDTPFIAMEFLEGGSLDKVIESRAKLPLAQKLGYIVYVCRALDYAHARGVVHRDIKPGNIMVTSEGTVKVVDFGIARLAGSGRTQTGILIGTLGYMSPQQIRGKPADARSDIWAVGIMLHELLTNQRPFNGENHAELMMNILTQATPSVSDFLPSNARDVSAVLEKMLQKEVEPRYQTMQEVLIDLDPIWERLQQEEVLRLIESGQQMLEARNLGQAQELLRRALQFDTTNSQAKSLLEKINAEVRRQQIIPQVRARVQKGQDLLSTRQLDEAKAEVEAALHLDSTYQPARDLLAEVQSALERERTLAQALRTGRQRLIEGDLEDAEVQVAKALQLDPASAGAQELRRQIQEEKFRRERQRKLSEIKHQARTMWSELRYQECIDLLLEAQAEFPGDSEVSKLLETAQQDKAEYEKQLLLTGARGLLGAQQFDDAIEVLDRALKQSPGDPTATNLRTLAIQGRERQILERQLNEDLAKLRALVKEGKYPEAIASGEKLLQKYPKEFEIPELISYARSEQAQLEKKRRREQWLDKINQGISADRYQEALQAAEAALSEFPRDTDLKILLEKAKQRQQQKERTELLDRRIREVRSKINRQELTDAISIARETLVTLGPNTDISQLLNQAEVEYEQREKKKQNQQETLEAAQTLIDQGDFGGATRVMEDALATRLFSSADPQVTALLRDMDKKKTPPPEAAPPPAPRPPAPSPASPPASWTAPSGDPGKDYVYQRGAQLPETPAPAQQDASASMIFSATSVTGPAVQPVVPPPPIPEIKEPAKEKKQKKRQPAAPVQPDEVGATFIAQAPAPPAEPGLQAGATQIGAMAPIPAAERSPVLPPPPRPAEAIPRPAAQPIWKQPIAIAAIGGLVLAGAIGGGLYWKSAQQTTTSENRPVQQQAEPQALPQPAPSTQPLPPASSQTQPQPQPRPQGLPPAQTQQQPQSAARPQAVPQAQSQQRPPQVQPQTPPQPQPQQQLPQPAPQVQTPPQPQSQPQPQPAPQPQAQPQPAAPVPALKAEEPRSAPTAPPAEDPQIAVRKVFTDLSGAFAGKNIGAIQQLWPSMPKGDAGKLKNSFSSMSSFSRNFNPASISVNGDTATASGSYSGAFSLGSSSTPSNGTFQASLKKEAGRWVITNLTM